MQGYDYRAQIDIFRDRNVQIGAAVGLIVGLILGWFVLGWWIAPVQWVDARPSDLHPKWQKHYVAMVVDSFLLSGDSEIARARLDEFDDATLSSLFGEVLTEFEQRGAERQANGTRQLADLLGVTIVRGTPSPAQATAVPTRVAGPTTAPGGGVTGLLSNRVVQVCGIVLGVLLVAAAGVAGFFWFRERSLQYAPEGGEGRQPAKPALYEPRITSINLGERAEVEYHGEGPGYDRTVQIYKGAEIIGTCGLRGVSTLSDAGRVVACAAWLYEPQMPERSADTCVLASRRVYQNEALRASLTHEREPGQVIPAEPGQIAYLEHETLEMTVRVLDVEYADPDEQYISRLVVELEPATKRREPGQPAPFDFT